jgi:hypothetical protein
MTLPGFTARAALYRSTATYRQPARPLAAPGLHPAAGCPPVNCTLDDIEDTYRPNPADCGSFYQCVWGQPHLIQCPDGMHFNPETNVCDWPQNVNCRETC